jgi:hypothetical protein
MEMRHVVCGSPKCIFKPGEKANGKLFGLGAKAPADAETRVWLGGKLNPKVSFCLKLERENIKLFGLGAKAPANAKGYNSALLRACLNRPSPVCGKKGQL